MKDSTCASNQHERTGLGQLFDGQSWKVNLMILAVEILNKFQRIAACSYHNAFDLQRSILDFEEMVDFIDNGNSILMGVQDLWNKSGSVFYGTQILLVSGNSPQRHWVITGLRAVGDVVCHYDELCKVAYWKERLVLIQMNHSMPISYNKRCKK